MNRSWAPLILLCFAVVGLPSHAIAADSIRSNGKGGGLWSAPTTWQGGRVPAGEPVVILGKDVVDLDSTAGAAVKCEELTIDPKGALRVIGKNKTQLNVTLGRALRIFGGMMVDFSKDPEGRCEFQWASTPGVTPEIQAVDGCKILWKGATNASPNVAFRIVTTNGLAAGAPIPKSISFGIGPKMSVESEHVALEGFDVQVTGVDGSGLKYNERCSFKRCEFVRGSVMFQSCTKIEFEGNHVMDCQNATCLYIYSVGNSRFVSNTFERATGAGAGIGSYGSVDCEIVDNVVRGCSDGIGLTACTDIFLVRNRLEGSRSTGITLNSCARITSQQCTFSSNTWVDVRAVYGAVTDPWKFYDCVFVNPPTNAAAACLSVEGLVPVEIVNSPLQTYLKDGQRGSLSFSAYVDIFVTNEQNVQLGRVPIRVLSGAKVVATSRTEAVGVSNGHTPLPSSHRPLVLPWYRYAPAEGLANPATSMSYQVEVDGTTLGYTKQTVPLAVDASYVRPDPEKPNKTLSVKLTKAK